MKHITVSMISLILALFSASSLADSNLVVSDAWVREAPPGAAMLAAYMTISNRGPAPRVLTGVESPNFSHVMLHRSVVIDGIARMIHQDALEIPAGGSLVLEPGSYHLMMPAPADRLERGDCVEFTLHMKNGESLAVRATVKRAGEGTQ